MEANRGKKKLINIKKSHTKVKEHLDRDEATK